MAATGVAFAVTEHLKLEPSPIFGTRITKQFSPTCNCGYSQAWIKFKLRHGDQVSLVVLGPRGKKVVRQLANEKWVDAGLFRSIWDGRDSHGRLLPDGNYKVRVHLVNERRTIILPNVIKLDTTPPKITNLSVSPRTVSPDGDHHKDLVHISYRLNERGSVVLFVDGKRNERTKYRKSGTFDWGGMINHRVHQGWHTLTLRAVDSVGNKSAQTAPISVRVRILRVRPGRIRVAARHAVRVRISTDRRRVMWKLAGHHGRARHETLTVRAPATPGKYRLLLSSGPYKAGTIVIVH
jgi:hypothetical protein